MIREILMFLPGLSQFFTSVILPLSAQLLKFTLPRIINIPRYLQLLWTIYNDSGTNSEARKYLTCLLLIISSILSFMAYSYVPLTGVPIIGAMTTPVAAMLAIVIILASLDIILKLNRDYLLSQYPEDLQFINSEIDALSNVLGKPWENVIKQTQNLLDSAKEKIDADTNYDDTIITLTNSFISYLRPPKDDGSLSMEEIRHRIIAEGLPPLAKIGGSITEGITAGTLAGISAHGTATTIFTQAGLLTSLKAAFGLSSGIAISGSAYSLLTVAAPIGLTAIIGGGVFHGVMQIRNEGEKRKISTFMADILIAGLPMAWIDGDFSIHEQDTLEKLLLNSAINERDVKRVRAAMIEQKSFEEILYSGILKEENPDKARLKYRLLLCTAWELATSDGVISTKEVELHNRMAEFMKISAEEVTEIRQLILLKSGINIRERISIIQGDITQESVDAIVNSSNKNLMPGHRIGWLSLPFNNKKIDIAIHNAAGHALQKECQNLNNCDVGEVKITQAYNLPSKWILHTVSPFYSESNSQEKLAKCYQNSLILAHKKSISTIAFPSLGTGQGKFPLEQAAKIAVTETLDCLNKYLSIKVKFVCHDEESYEIYRQTLEEIIGSQLGEPLKLMPVTSSTPLLAN
ncbi:appr-1-p processing domain-containing protein [Richelia sinica FACHB-800]|uniref:Appr-1-p processing domain-containing protein n=1 Tax=Richelia sinica FACHB-800 TaxID=1357546 RepID=A0A975TDF2_9NOST|nr:macro domain-containing protein [Richelia sinica]MBD2665143.1 macro domain-containing protein [Richelia sinica FACHB-800]QXE25901.1 appr-1-p processing domain-containing protein [Richelia sinica FACHB-800]